MDAKADTTDMTASADRLAALRAELKKRGLAGFVVPLQDEHQAEWVPAHARRLQWLTGFTGSAGVAVVLEDKAAIFVDGRYTLQVRSQTDTNLFTPRHLSEEPASDWITENLGTGVLGFDPWLQTSSGVENYRKACEKAGGKLQPCDSNPVDAVWPDRPAPPLTPMVAHGTEFAGESSTEKRERLAKDLAKEGIDAAVLTFPDSIAWLLNVRGGDLEYSPVTLCFALLRADASVELFVDPRKVGADTVAHLGNAVTLSRIEDFAPALDKLGADKANVLADPATAASFVFQRLTDAGAEVMRGPDPCVLPKARKNGVELGGMRAAHVRDGGALTRFLAWLSTTGAPNGLDEMAAAKELYRFRSGGEKFQRQE